MLITDSLSSIQGNISYVSIHFSRDVRLTPSDASQNLAKPTGSAETISLAARASQSFKGESVTEDTI